MPRTGRRCSSASASRCAARLLSLLPAIVVAWLLTRRRFPGRLLFDAVVHLPLVLPPVLIGYLLLLLFGIRGPIGAWLHERFGVQLAFTTALARRWPRRPCPFH